VFSLDPCSGALRTEVHGSSFFRECLCFYVRDDVYYPLIPVDTERVRREACAALGRFRMDVSRYLDGRVLQVAEEDNDSLFLAVLKGVPECEGRLFELMYEVYSKIVSSFLESTDLLRKNALMRKSSFVALTKLRSLVRTTFQEDVSLGPFEGDHLLNCSL